MLNVSRQMRVLLTSTLLLVLLLGGPFAQAAERFRERSRWDPEAEPALADIAKNETEQLKSRDRAVLALLRRFDINNYMPLAIEVILAHPRGIERCAAFSHVTNAGNRLFTMNETNRHAFLSTGFRMLAELPEDRLRDGYFVARHLGFVLGIKDEFTPDQSAKEYQGEYGLADKFFAHTTRNALLWYSKNKKTLEGN
jgi:hypothetical protein